MTRSFEEQDHISTGEESVMRRMALYYSVLTLIHRDVRFGV
jgi:hypothetical protein